MLPSAKNWEAIMAAMTCLCASTKDGVNDNFITDLTNELNSQYPNETRVFITSKELQGMQTKISDLETAIIQLQAQQTKVLAAVKDLVTPTFCPHSDKPVNVNSLALTYIKIPQFKDAQRVVCNGEWLIILWRKDGSLNFYHPWPVYKRGFGGLEGEFFIGLEKLHILTKAKPCELKIHLTDFGGGTRIAIYDRFEIGSEEEGYLLKVLGSFSGNAGDSLRKHVGKKFTTYDRDNDMNDFGNCAELSTGAWWYTDEPCHESNLFGHWSANPNQRGGRGIVWQSFGGFDHSLEKVEMMIRLSKKCR